MQKIINESLKLAGYKNHEELAKVVNATPNPIAATEMLLGVFEEIHPEAFGELWKTKHSNDVSILVVERIDSLTNTVYYTLYQYNTKTVYYLTREDYNNKVFVEERPPYNQDWYTSGTIRVNGYNTLNDLSSDIKTFTDINTKCTRVDSLYEWALDADNYGIEPKTEVETANFEMAE